MGKKLTTDEFIKRAKEVHGEKYLYNKTTYNSMHINVIITCAIHGDFEQEPTNHLCGKGCKLCGSIRGPEKQQLSKEEFVNRSNIIHNNKYNYDKTVYLPLHNKLTITCPLHGDFKQRGLSHLKGYGCSGCSKNKKMDTVEFVERSNKIHNNKYNYDNTFYVRSLKKVIIACPKHGEFLQTPNKHLNGQGCPKCTIERGNVGVNEKDHFQPFIKEYFNGYTIEFQYPVYTEVNSQYPFKIDVVVKELNLAIEYDEGHHKYRIEYDSFRQQLIEGKTGFKFIRVDDKIFMKEGKKYFESLL